MNPAPSQLVNCTGLADCFQKIYNLFFSIFLALAFLYFLYGAFEYLLSGASITRKEVGRSKMVSSIVALIIVLVMPVIINIINPEIFKGAEVLLPVLKLEKPKTISLYEILKTYYNSCDPEPSGRTERVQPVPESQLITIKNTGGPIWCSPEQNCKVLKEVHDNLMMMGMKVVVRGPDDTNLIDCKLRIISGYRSIEEQERLWNTKFNELKEKWGGSEEEIEQKVKECLAKPGYSSHHTGKAIDVFLSCYDKETGYDITSAHPTDVGRVLLNNLTTKILTCPPWHRPYKNNPVHFEFIGWDSSRCN